MSVRIVIKSFLEALKQVSSGETKAVVKLFKVDYKKKIEFSGIFTSKKEIEDSIKERVVDYLTSKHVDLKSRISALRKRGVDVEGIDYELMKAPLKIKLLLAEFIDKNYLVVKKILAEVDKRVALVESKNKSP